MIDSTFIQKIIELAPGGNVTIDDEMFTSKQYFRLPEKPAKPLVATLECATLTGVVDYIQKIGLADLLDDEIVSDGMNVIVNSPTRVSVVSNPVAPAMKPHTFLIADCSWMPSYKFGAYQPVIDTIVAIQTLFLDTPDRAALLLALGTIKDENIATNMDDGVSQTATFSSGITLVENRKIPNPVNLGPFRTFREIVQPESRFVVRIQKGKDGIMVALFEADGGLWRLQAISDIRDYLAASIEIPIIA